MATTMLPDLQSGNVFKTRENESGMDAKEVDEDRTKVDKESDESCCGVSGWLSKKQGAEQK